MSPYILLRLEPQSPMPLPCRCFAHAQHSAGSFSVTLTTQHTITPHDHIHTSSTLSTSGGGLKFVYASTYFLIHCDVQFVHHRNTSALFSPPTADISVQIAQQPVDYLWFTPLVRPMVSLSFTVVPLKSTHGLPQLLPQITISSHSTLVEYVLHYHKSYVRHK